MSSSEEDQVRQRRANLDGIMALGYAAYPNKFDTTHTITQLVDAHTATDAAALEAGKIQTVTAGRIVGVRSFGKTCFYVLSDGRSRIQVYVKQGEIGERDQQLQKLLDSGDQIGVSGHLFRTKTNELSVWASSLSFLAKCFLPLPEKWHGLQDVEVRYRQRYLDMIVNPDVRRVFEIRTATVSVIRDFLRSHGFLEVETPMMQPLAGGALARPFVTHHNALDIPLYLRIAPELYLKRLLVGGFSKVFELNRNFRNEGISPRHNPEFTMLEAYEAYGSWQTMADLVEGMVCHIAEKLFGGLKIEHKNAAGEVTKTINLARPWRRVRMVDLVA